MSRLITLFILPFVAVANADWYNTQTASVVGSLPNPMGATHNPTPRMYADAGWLPAVRAVVPDGQQVVSSAWAVTGGVAVESVTTEPIPPRIPPASLLQGAALFRLIMQANFGTGAETNQAITEASVNKHFLDKRLAGTLTPSDAADMMVLGMWFPQITAWTGDGTVWTFPFHLIPEPETP